MILEYLKLKPNNFVSLNIAKKLSIKTLNIKFYHFQKFRKEIVLQVLIPEFKTIPSWNVFNLTLINYQGFRFYIE